MTGDAHLSETTQGLIAESGIVVSTALREWVAAAPESEGLSVVQMREQDLL